MTDDLTDLTDEETSFLTERIRHGVCVTFHDHPLPPGTEPVRGRVGIESREDHVVLHVDRGLAYTGDNPAVRTWLASGSTSFSSVETAGRWLARANNGPAEPRPRSRPDVSGPEDLVHLDDVQLTEERPVQAGEVRAGLAERVAGHRPILDLLAVGSAQHLAKPFARRPWSMMLLGPTGVGKTSIALALARTLSQLTDGAWRFSRYDMAEFTERHSVSRLVGAAPGYVGYGDRSLASSLAEEPRHVVLFDEMEKAHPEVQLSLMNLMDAGRLDSARHGEVAASQALLMFTSNVASDGVVVPPGGSSDHAGRAAMLAHGMPRELVARFGAVAALEPLPPRDMAAAAVMAVAAVAADYGCTVTEVAPAYLSAVLAEATSSGLGVRVLEHLVDRQLGSELASAPARVSIAAGPPYVVATRELLASSAPGDPNDDEAPKGSPVDPVEE